MALTDAPPEDQARMLAWAKRALRGLDDSAVFVGILDDRPLDVARLEFTLQLGHALLTGKPILLPVPHGVAIPPGLTAAATRIIYYNPVDLASLQHGLEIALTELGLKPQ